MLKHETDRAYARGEYRWVRRAKVLGRLCEIKRTMYAKYEQEYDEAAKYDVDFEEES